MNAQHLFNAIFNVSLAIMILSLVAGLGMALGLRQILLHHAGPAVRRDRLPARVRLRTALPREGLFQFMTAFSLPWYAIVGAQKGVNVGLPVLGCLLLAVVGPTAGRYYIDLTSGKTPKQFIKGEYFVTTALLTGLIWILVDWAGLSTWWAAGIAFVVGFTFRLVAMFRGWEEPLPHEPKGVVIHKDHVAFGRKLEGKSQRELADLGLVVDNGQPTSSTAERVGVGSTS